MNDGILNITDSIQNELSRPSENPVSLTVQRCIDGDQAAQRQLFMQLAPRMKVVCLRYAGDPDLAKDFMQEGFIRFFEKLKQFKGNSSIETWATRLFMNNCISLLNKDKKRRVAQESWDDNLDVEDDTELDELPYTEAYLLQKITELPDGYRTVLNLYVFEQLSHQEIADMLGISVNTSKTQFFKAKKVLKALLEEGRTS